MRKLSWISICLFLATAYVALAQTPVQQGVVKTRGRMVNGKLQPGQGLPGATVHVKGNGNEKTLGVKNQNGSFSFNVPGTIFNVTKVQKQGYQLVDADLTTKPVQYSKNTLYIVMETPQQQAQDKLASERKIRRTLETQLHAREDEIEALKEQNKITMEEYRKALQQLYADQESNEKLIKEMAERYATLDYDQLDEFYRQVSYYIEEGELTCADSLLRTRGNVVEQVAEQLQKGQVIQAQEEQLNKAKAVHKLDNEELAHRCYSKYEIFKSLYENDSAAFYLKLRASIDTSNVEWQCDAGIFISEYIADYDKALSYYNRALHQSCIQYGKDSEWVAVVYNNIGVVYYQQGKYSKALECLQKASKITENTLGAEHSYMATPYINIGNIYVRQGDYKKAVEIYSKSLEITENALGLKNTIVAACNNNIGIVYYSMGKARKALPFYIRALEIYKDVLGSEHLDVANTYNNIGMVYCKQKDYEKALESYNQSLEINKKLLSGDHPCMSAIYINMGILYDKLGDYEKALNYYKIALIITEKMLGPEHVELAVIYNDMGTTYSMLGEYKNAIDYYSKALIIYENTFGVKYPHTKAIKKNMRFARLFHFFSKKK